MALDIVDNLTQSFDIQITPSDKYRTFNLLKKKFEDNQAIGLDIAQMMQFGLHLGQIEGIFLQYLSRFNVIVNKFSIKKIVTGLSFLTALSKRILKLSTSKHTQYA